MVEPWRDEGTIWEDSGPKVDQWFPVRTETGEWQLPGQPTLARSAGMPDVTAPPVMGSTPDQAPLALGQVAGTMAPPMTVPASMARVARADQSGLLTPKPSMWESIARAVGQASPTGARILQASDQQQQQQLTNRLALRRQQLVEDQEARQVVKDEYATLIELSKVKSKALRNMYFDRQAARLAEAGKPYPADFIESFKKSALDEGQIIAQAYGPLLEKIGYKPEQVQGLLEGGDLETIKGVVDAGLKIKKFETDADEAKQLQRIQAGGGGTLADVSGVQAPPAPGTPTTPAPTTPTAGQGTVPPVLDTAVTEATKLYPQVRPDLVHGIIRHESNYDVGAVSPKGAIGPMQLMPDTAKDMGVDPKDPAQNVRGGVRYYAQMLTKYGGNEALALAAYNWGPGNVDKVDGDLTKMPAETQAYVKNVLASAAPGGQRAPADTRQQVAGPGAPAPTTTAPSAVDTAALTRLKEAIAVKQGQIQQLSGLSSERANKVADNMRADLKILQEQYNRLEDRLTETPRAVAKQTALQKGELTKAGEAERVKAGLERASREEIDAINRTLPPDKRLSYGTTREEIRQGRYVGGSELPQTVMEGFTDRATVVRQLGDLGTKLGDLPTGPWASKVEAFKQYFGIDVKDEAVAYRTLLAAVHNQLALARGGKALTPQEVARIEKELPTEGNPPQVFQQKLKTAAKVAEDIYRLKAQFYRRAGYGVPEDMMTPWETTLETKEGKGLLEDMKRGK
jgi:Transglycosylase SLT domain